MIVNENIKYIREVSELTQVQFSNVFRIPLSSLKNWENTDVMPKVDLLNNLSKVLEVPVDTLLNRKLTSKDINWKRLDMEKIVRGEKELDIWADTPSNSSEITSHSKEKFIELQNEYIETLKLQDTALSNFQQLLKDANDQRMIDVKVLIGRTDELSKRLDRLESHFDETRASISKYINEVAKIVENMRDEFYTNSKEKEKEMKEINTRLDKVDPPNHNNNL